MCLLGYFGFLRYSELANLRRSDIRIFQDRLELFIKQSKTDKLKEGPWIVISATGNTVCPKTHLLAYMNLANINDNSNNYIFWSVVKTNSNNYIFQSVVKTKSGYKLHKSRKLSYTRAREILLGNLEKVGLPKGSFGLHSLRSGGATTAGNSGVPERLIQKHGRWKSESSSKNRYIHEA